MTSVTNTTVFLRAVLPFVFNALMNLSENLNIFFPVIENVGSPKSSELFGLSYALLLLSFGHEVPAIGIRLWERIFSLFVFWLLANSFFLSLFEGFLE